MSTIELYDVIIVGAGPAGLNAALILGRCRRNILIFDTGTPRNKRSHALHGYLTRDGMNPEKFLELGRLELEKYGVNIMHEKITSAFSVDNKFKLINENGKEYQSKKLLLATGLKDNIPQIDGMEKFFGSHIFHCPYCDGWESRDKAIAVYGMGKRGFDLALSLKTWSADVVLLTDGEVVFTPQERQILNVNEIPVYMQKVKSIQGDLHIEKVLFENNQFIQRDIIFICNGYTQQSDLGHQLNLNFSDKKVVLTDSYQETSIYGLFMAGDADRDMHFIIIAAAEGAKAGTRINMELQQEHRMSLVAQRESFST